MSNIVQCPCGQKLKVTIPAGGGVVACPACGQQLRIGDAPSGAARQLPPASQPTGSFTDFQFPTAAPQQTPNPSPSSNWQAPYAHPRRGSQAKPKSQTWTILAIVAGISSIAVAGIVAVVIAVLIKRGPNQDRGNGVFQDRPLAQKDPSSTAKASKTPLKSVNPISDTEALDFAEAFSANLKTGNLVAANLQVDWVEIIRQSVSQYDISDSSREKMVTNLARPAKSGFGVLGNLRQRIGNRLAVLRMRQRDGHRVVLLRGGGIEKGLSYLELKLGRNEADRIQVDDIYFYAAGEWVTETQRRALLPVAVELNRSFLSKLSGKQGDWIKHFPKIDKMIKSMSHSPQRCLEAYRNLPASVRKDKNLMLIRVAAASSLNDGEFTEYRAAMEDFRRTFPNDEAFQFQAIDYYALRGEPNKSIEAIEALNRTVGGDSALHTLMAAIWMGEQDISRAREALQTALELDPNYTDAQRMLRELP